MDTVTALTVEHGVAKCSSVGKAQTDFCAARRIWSLRRFLGGDLASRYPVRLAAAMLKKAGVDAEGWLLANSRHLPHGGAEAKLVFAQVQKGIALLRPPVVVGFLDAVAAVLGVCFQRTYEGEPAMKLESAALTGKDALNLNPNLHGNVLDTSTLIGAIFDNLGRVSASVWPISAHAYLAKGLALLAIEKAAQHGVKAVGFSGGAACNLLLAQIMRQKVEAAGLPFYVHVLVPAGDGGVSFGQAVVAGFSKF